MSRCMTGHHRELSLTVIIGVKGRMALEEYKTCAGNMTGSRVPGQRYKVTDYWDHT